MGRGVPFIRVKLQFLDPAFDDVEFLAVFVESHHQKLELLTQQGPAVLRLGTLLDLLLDLLAQEDLVVHDHHANNYNRREIKYI
jgi:hypothetical protein